MYSSVAVNLDVPFANQVLGTQDSTIRLSNRVRGKTIAYTLPIIIGASILIASVFWNS